MNDKREILKKKLLKSFKPLFEALAVHKQNLEFMIEFRQIGVLPGIVVEIRPDKSDAPRIYGKSRQNYNALCVIAETIGHYHSIPVRLGTMHDAVIHTPEEGRHWRDRKEPIDGIEPLEHIRLMLESVACEMFKGDSPRVDVAIGAGGAVDFNLHISPGNARFLQKQWESLQTLFKAICAPYGWLPSVNMEQDLQIAERQPPTADGRFCKEIRR